MYAKIREGWKWKEQGIYIWIQISIWEHMMANVQTWFQIWVTITATVVIDTEKKTETEIFKEKNTN